ncbi:DNA-directed RNA polymerase subunit alpha C-terminal domain-containing protein [Rhizobacter sp. Root1221]|uniref:DNA-directed RNA polymerase subunit alpha C-terminal domain-containing protein n=1 Tax=Rhizobacter sp. Root1221 TaxID=1736433 RepID=UPI0006F29452|nr:DNA-directed RNA polymerase subunit alpha C-terminal domain-containing protein [Rhizobacter sp. Root1221]KQV85542.1 hypothetical protein ASC87_07610 [Rhizobacter sp. Root1221]
MLSEKCSRAEDLRASGRSVADIAAELHVTRQRVRQLLASARAERLRQVSDDPFLRLSARTANGLKAEFLYVRKQLLTVDTVAEALHTGRLRTVRNLGKKSVEEIERWLESVQADEERDLLEQVTDPPSFAHPQPPCPRPSPRSAS